MPSLSSGTLDAGIIKRADKNFIHTVRSMNSHSLTWWNTPSSDSANPSHPILCSIEPDDHVQVGIRSFKPSITG